MQLFVKSLTRRETFTVECEPSHSVADLKAQIAQLEGTPAQLQRLILGGHNLQDDQLLADAGVGKGCTVHLVQRVVGSGAAAPEAPASNNSSGGSGADLVNVTVRREFACLAAGVGREVACLAGASGEWTASGGARASGQHSGGHHGPV